VILSNFDISGMHFGIAKAYFDELECDILAHPLPYFVP